MAHRPPIVAVVSDDHRVGRALVAYLSSNGSATTQVIGPYTYHADQGQFARAVLAKASAAPGNCASIRNIGGSARRIVTLRDRNVSNSARKPSCAISTAATWQPPSVWCSELPPRTYPYLPSAPALLSERRLSARERPHPPTSRRWLSRNWFVNW